MILQKGMRLQFSGGDVSRVPRVQLVTSGDESRFPSIQLYGGPRIQKVQVVSGGDPSRVPKIQIKNLAAWFKYNTGITVTGAGVSQWDDMSGHGRHLKQGTDTNRPALQSDGSILFDGVDNYLKCDAFTLDQPASVYFLGKQVTWTSTDTFFDGNTARSMRLFQVGSTPQIAIDAGAAAATNGNLAVDTYGVICVVYNGASSILQVNNTTATTGDVSTGNAGGFTLGANGNNLQFGHIQVKEVLIFNVAHNSQDRSNVIAYLASVGGLAL